MFAVRTAIWKPIGDEKFKLNFSPRLDFPVVMTTSVDDMLALWPICTAMTVLVFISASKE